MPMSTIDILKKATEGLDYVSESNHPFEVLEAEKTTVATLLDGEDYADLVCAIGKTLTDVQVYKAGKLERDVLIFGKDADGEYVCIRTTSVET